MTCTTIIYLLTGIVILFIVLLTVAEKHFVQFRKDPKTIIFTTWAFMFLWPLIIGYLLWCFFTGITHSIKSPFLKKDGDDDDS